MDATATLRSFFKENQFHDYETQEKGPDAKVVKQIFYVRPNTLEPALVLSDK